MKNKIEIQAERALLRDMEASQAKLFDNYVKLVAKERLLKARAGGSANTKKRSAFKALSAAAQMAFCKAGGKVVGD